MCAKKGEGDWPACGSAPVYSYSKYLCILNRQALLAHFNGIKPTFPECPTFLANKKFQLFRGWGGGGALTPLHI